MKKKTLDPKLKHIGMVRYAGDYTPSNEQSQKYWQELAFKVVLAKDPHFLAGRIPREIAKQIAKWGKLFGYEVHFFEKGLGR